MEASCWVARKIFLSAASASSRARTLDCRPTTNGVIMKGKMTTSRMGIMGSFTDSNLSLAGVMGLISLYRRRRADSRWERAKKLRIIANIIGGGGSQATIRAPRTNKEAAQPRGGGAPLRFA